MTHPLQAQWLTTVSIYSGSVLIERDFGGLSMKPGYWVCLGDAQGVQLVAHCQMDDFGNLVRM